MASPSDEQPRTGRDPDILTAAELAEFLGIKDPQTVRDAAAEPGGIPGLRIGRERRFSRRAVYEWIAGPGIPGGEILTAEALGRRIGIPSRTLRRASAPPGTPGKIPGRQVGRKWLYALEAVRAAIKNPAAPGAADGSGQG